ncbi:MAG: site-2 protease family protein [Candidatus Paceibacterota bacterium]
MEIIALKIAYLILVWLVLVFSVVVHECAHGIAALKLGDDTAYILGRITLNPIKHIDLIMTIIMPLILYFTIGIPFGGAKPVPINPNKFRDPDKGFMLTSMAGPASNFILAFIGMIGFIAVMKFLPLEGFARDINKFFFQYFIITNVILGLFNLIPIPPLDGSRILRYFLPWHMKEAFDRLEMFGLVIVAFLVISGGTSFIYVIIDPLFRLLQRIAQ